MKTSKIIAILVLFLFSAPLYSQLTQPQLDSLVNIFKNSLKKRGVDTICIYKQYCTGCLFQPVKGGTLCTENYASMPTYVFWKEKGKTYATRKDICFEYNIQEIASDSIWTFYLQNQSAIRNEELKEPQYEETINGNKKIRSVSVEHSVFFHLSISIAGNQLFKEINSFYFTQFLGPDEIPNVNYLYNNSTYLNKIHMIIQRIIKSDSVKQQFKRKLR